jgi:hypothetical protein
LLGQGGGQHGVLKKIQGVVVIDAIDGDVIRIAINGRRWVGELLCFAIAKKQSNRPAWVAVGDNPSMIMLRHEAITHECFGLL